MVKSTSLYSAQELEEVLGKKYFYRQGTYRLAEAGKIKAFQINNKSYFSKDDLVLVTLERLAERIERRHPWVPPDTLRVKYNQSEGKKITIYGFSRGESIAANTDKETEAELLGKIETIRREVKTMPDVPVKPHHRPHPVPPPPPHEAYPEPPHHRDVMEALERIEDRLRKVEEKLG